MSSNVKLLGSDFLEAYLDADTDLLHYGVKGMKWGKTKAKDTKLLGDTASFPHNGLDDEDNLIKDPDGNVLLDLSRIPKGSAMRNRIMSAAFTDVEFTYRNGELEWPKDFDWKSLQARANVVARQHHASPKEQKRTPVFNDHAKISAKIKQTSDPNRREVILKKPTTVGTGKPYLKQSGIPEYVSHGSAFLEAYLEEDTELLHYGVMGMKWGVRKNPNRAFKRAISKHKSLTKKTNRLKRASSKQNSRGLKKLTKGVSKRGLKIGQDKLIREGTRELLKGDKLGRKATKSTRKTDAWLSEMHKTFKDIDVSQIDPKIRERGSDYIYMLIR